MPRWPMFPTREDLALAWGWFQKWGIYVVTLATVLGAFVGGAQKTTAGAGGQTQEERLRALEAESVRAARERATVLVMLHEWERHGTAVDRQLLANQRAMLMGQHRTQQALARIEGRRR